MKQIWYLKKETFRVKFKRYFSSFHLSSSLVLSIVWGSYFYHLYIIYVIDIEGIYETRHLGTTLENSRGQPDGLTLKVLAVNPWPTLRSVPRIPMVEIWLLKVIAVLYTALWQVPQVHRYTYMYIKHIKIIIFKQQKKSEETINEDISLQLRQGFEWDSCHETL